MIVVTVKGLLIKVSPETHAGLQTAAARHQRSMQNVLVALIERWLAVGAPDPLQFDMATPPLVPPDVVDREARRAIEALVERVHLLQEQVNRGLAGREAQRQGWAERVVADLAAGAGDELPEVSRRLVARLSPADQQLLGSVPDRSLEDAPPPPPETWASMFSSFLNYVAEQKAGEKGPVAAPDEAALDAHG